MKLVAGFWLGDTLMDQTQGSCTHSSPINMSDSGKDRTFCIFCAVLVLYSGMCHHHTHKKPMISELIRNSSTSPAWPPWSCVLSVLRALERALALASVSWCVKAEGMDQWKSMAEMVRNGTSLSCASSDKAGASAKMQMTNIHLLSSLHPYLYSCHRSGSYIPISALFLSPSSLLLSIIIDI